MMVMVLATLRGIELLPLRKVERYSHALSGFAVLMCGVAVTFMGL